jgi:UDPglucose 6-dehydrogenase
LNHYLEKVIELKNINHPFTINVIGYGVVGKAQAYLLETFGHHVFVYDPALKKEELAIHADLTFICTPERVVEGVIQLLQDRGVNPPYVIKSTVSIGTTASLGHKYATHICHNPEFLRERSPFHDVLHPDRIVIGECCSLHGQQLTELYHSMHKPIFRTTPSSSETIKLVSNAYLSTLITFWNEINELTTQLDIDINMVAKAVTADTRISQYGTMKFGEAFDGKCLPKDMNHLINGFYAEGLNPLLFEAINTFNNQLNVRTQHSVKDDGS